jgi:L-rhamnose isomerase
MSHLESAYTAARERYAELGVDTEQALKSLSTLRISLQCWQGDDVGGFEPNAQGLSGGVQVTGSYPGRARSIEELRQDIDTALKLIPGKHRLNLHAIYGDFEGRRVERDALTVAPFESWIAWAKERGLALDFNPTCFSHPLSADGFTLSHADASIRSFWIRHAIACRRIGAEMGRRLGSPCVTNIWIPDGYKDTPHDRRGPRERLASALDEILAEVFPRTELIDAVEPKLFGIGSESYVVGSHEFYLGYCARKGVSYCLDAGHFHPTESIADKLSSLLLHVPSVLLHVSRGVRWDSDHVVTLDDQTRAIGEEVIRCGEPGRVHLGMDFFDASINRIAAWTIGARSLQKALLIGLLEPAKALRDAETRGDYTTRLALLEESRALPFGAVWDRFCQINDTPTGCSWLDSVRDYERTVLSKRS